MSINMCQHPAYQVMYQEKGFCVRPPVSGNIFGTPCITDKHRNAITLSAMERWEKGRFKVYREDHFYRPGFLRIIIYVFFGYKASNFVKNWMLPMFKKPQNLKGLTVNLVLGLFKQRSRVQIFLLFCRTNPNG